MKRKKMLAVLLAVSMTCGVTAATGSLVMAEETTEAAEETTEETTEAAEASDDQAAADNVAALIDKIYVQERTDTTDDDCTAAKEAWDQLTDAQKELVEGEEASPEYFGRDTGDASKDDPRNADEIGENELLVVSFGTSFNDSRVEDIKGIEDALQEAYPDWSVRRAFTAQIIINHIQARDEEKIDNMQQALDRAVENGVKNLVVQPTHLMHGAEYDEMKAAIDEYQDKFESIAIAEPLLGEVGEDQTTVNEDKEAVAAVITDEAVKEAGYDSLDAAEADGTAFVFMGHGTSHKAAITYNQMQSQMDELGYKNVFVGTVEGKPEDTSCEAVIDKVKEAGYKKVILRPLMVVAGDHANNDMAGDEEDSWKSQFIASGNFDSVDAQIAGLGRIDAVKQIYVDHTKAAIDSLGTEDVVKETTETADAELEDGTYSASFDTDSGMFHVSEANDGKGTLTVKDGRMTIHVSLASKGILNLFVGKAEDAKKDKAELLEPTTDTVTYSDGTTEEVYGFDIPVPAIDEEFDVALVGKKGKWYDHKVKVSDVQKLEETKEEETEKE
ncbi:MAG: sirohydrochlorin cobaltochelatase [Blautia sp.]|nr:sirohydrochlorin cobaltochelatase [Blautia sp.]